MILGITGISGSGKHTAAHFLEGRGWTVLDADKMAHDLYRPYTRVWKAVVKRFGEGILGKNDVIDRQKLSVVVFGGENPQKTARSLDDLNALVHPEVRRELESRLYLLRRGKEPVAVVAALWKEIGLKELCDKTLQVKADPKTARERVQKRDGITAAVYGKRAERQKPMPDPDWTLENNGTVEELYRRILKTIEARG